MSDVIHRFKATQARGHAENLGTQARGHEGTPTLKARGHEGTRARQHRWHEGTPKIWARRHEGTRARRNFGHEGTRRLKGTQGTQRTRFNRLKGVTNNGLMSNKDFWDLVKCFVSNKGVLAGTNTFLVKDSTIVTDFHKLCEIFNDSCICILENTTGKRPSSIAICVFD